MQLAKKKGKGPKVVTAATFDDGDIDELVGRVREGAAKENSLSLAETVKCNFKGLCLRSV